MFLGQILLLSCCSLVLVFTLPLCCTKKAGYDVKCCFWLFICFCRLVVTLTADKVWCNCPDFIQYRLPCKHLLSVAAKKLGNFPLVYQQAAEFNCTMQLKGKYCASVVDITELMLRHSDTDDTPCQEIGYHESRH
jgi:predicted nucleic acid-binding Zn finger protein